MSKKSTKQNDNDNDNKKAWSGVFTESMDRRVELFTESITFDYRLYEVDIRVSIAHARMLCDVGILSKAEFNAIEKGLREIKASFKSGKFEFHIDLEDIHMHIERALINKIGDVGRKLHTARSRNDQVATDLRLWIRESIDAVDSALVELQQAFIARCESDAGVILPAYTHTRRAQPVLAAHVWLAYCEKFERDRERLRECRKRVNVLSLGTAAAAGTSIPIDRNKTAEYLKFDSVAANSIDVSSDRDFVLDAAFCLVQIAIHTSTLAEEWILWSTAEFNFIKLPQSFCTGSSIMPQKLNPDTLELIRGKSARVIGNLQTLCVLTKGLPLAYNRDLQEDKQPIFDSFETIRSILMVAVPLVEKAELNHELIKKQLNYGYTDATTLMEFLILQGVPQRTAHEIVGKLVRMAMDLSEPLSNLSLKQFRSVYENFDNDVYKILGAESAISAMKSYGGTSPEQVDLQLQRWKKKLRR
ncbi:MAG: argininosuccinate lyase [Planctomycetaceae bacterium]|jgi:argininosuccinate lyase|nr:argininosuccinate lyase [Planctomycetaceae bacterium]